MRDCPGCHESLPLTAFYFYKSGSRAGKPLARCKKCNSTQVINQRKKNPERSRRQLKSARIRMQHGVGLEYIEELLRSQKGLCKICGVVLVSPCIDHDHEVGRIRGLLCSQCNVGLGMFHDSPTALREAADYLERKWTATK